MTRRILLVAHSGRRESVELARRVRDRLTEAGIEVSVAPGEGQALDLTQPIEMPPDLARHTATSELVLVLGGDGTILRGAEYARGAQVPLLGINLGHVGFLAEVEPDGVAETVERIVARDYLVEERMTLDVTCQHSDGRLYRSWALNEVAVEKAARERMLEVNLAVDDSPLSSFGCDGIIVATPTGSTAYAFSAGGPVIWPSVQAMLVVPNAAHALFARPLVLAPDSRVEIEINPEAEGTGVLWCDGRRHTDLTPGVEITVCRGSDPVRLARLSGESFGARLVTKLDLPTRGWRALRKG